VEKSIQYSVIETMKIQKFEDIIAWQRVQDWAVDIYSAMKNL